MKQARLKLNSQDPFLQMEDERLGQRSLSDDGATGWQGCLTTCFGCQRHRWYTLVLRSP